MDSRTDVFGTVTERVTVCVTLPLFAMTVTGYVPAGVVGLVTKVSSAAPDVLTVGRLKLADAPGIAEKCRATGAGAGRLAVVWLRQSDSQ